jgi:hypothetical protein
VTIRDITHWWDTPKLRNDSTGQKLGFRGPVAGPVAGIRKLFSSNLNIVIILQLKPRWAPVTTSTFIA